MIQFKHLCARCKKNFVLVSRTQFPVCYDCQKAELAQPIKNLKMKKLFAIPEDFYKQNAFLREIKMKYIRFGALTEKQVEAFKKVAAELRAQKKSAKALP
ncbi:hypothetical protein C4580_00865 [Candidatus Woesearchaeota archaeon]|nr:MAG: hypothetical protein C4580_00865 [Candidatus Woesearchaeota archaeon]